MASETASGPDPTLYLFTSLTAGSSHIITATSRLETILKANKIAFRALDCATDEKARTLWSRRSKGRKLPGLVKFGQVIGDLEAVEEWNEYGEIHENIESVSDILGDTPMTDTPMPPPAPITLKDPLAKTSEPPSRSSSQGRHISISDPKDKDGSGSPTSSGRPSRDETPFSMAMRQAGVEAAAKAGQKKASAVASAKSSSTASAIPAKRDSADITPTAAATKMSIEAEEPADAPEITAGKTPAQIASEGATKIADKAESDASSAASSSPIENKSNEEQLLEARRTSSVAKIPSGLQQETTVEDLKTPVPEQAITSETNLSSPPLKVGEARPSHHRGSSLSEASKEEIKEIEARNAIKEESGEESSIEDAKAKPTLTTESTVQATDEAEAEATKDTKPQDQKAKDADAAGVSAATAMFLSPSQNANPNRLSADSASVYSFFDSAFSPAPLFSGAQNLDLDLSFMEGLGPNDPRTSISTYNTENTDIHNTQNSTKDAGSSIYNERETTPRQSDETRRSESRPFVQQETPHREILPAMPVIAPLRTPARRKASDPLLSNSENRISTPTSVPLPLSIRKTPTNSSLASTNTSPSKSPQSVRSQPQLHTQLPSASHNLSPTHRHLHPQQQRQQQLQGKSPLSPPAPTSAITSPISPSATTMSTPKTPQSTNGTTPTQTPTTESRTLRLKKSLRSLRSKKSTQRLAQSPSPTSEKELPPNLPPQRQLKGLGVGNRSVSDTYVLVDGKRKDGVSIGVREREREKSGMKNLLCF